MMNVDLEALPIGEDAPETVNVIVEVPAGSRNKYEYEPELGVIMRDRVLPGNVRYPADYGFVPSTISVDGEPLDIVVAAYDPVFSGCVLRARVIGALEMGGEGGTEPNIFAVPADDPRFEDIESLDDMPEQNLREIENFFVTFSQLEGDEEAEVQGWHGLEETHEIIREGSRAYQEDRAYQQKD
jgi:inorganic pyrophosphatase